MTMHISPNSLIHATFNGLEAVDPAWQNDHAYWEEFNASFFAANGMAYDPAVNSNVANWVSATDRAPFAAMADALLAQLRDRVDLTDVSTVFLAHWLPDVHLGTSVTNYVMHALGLENAFGLAFSDRGLSAPLYAMDTIAKTLENKGGKALLLVMDQRNFLYRTPALDALDLTNSASAMVLDMSKVGLGYQGYTRRTASPSSDLTPYLKDMAAELGLDAKATTFVVSSDHIDKVNGLTTVPSNPAHACAAPFAVLQEMDGDAPVILVTCDDDMLCAVGFGKADDHAH
jgi:hypothetical protein